MIDSLHGRILGNDPDLAVLDVGGVRFKLLVPKSTSSALPAEGELATLLTRLSFNANDGEFALFGFATAAERDCFEILLGIPGIGPKKALAILSEVNIATFAAAIVGNDINALSKVKGVGKKTAERLVLELREKMVPYAAARTPGRPARPAAVEDAVAALVALGCRPPVAERAVDIAVGLLGEKAPTNHLVVEALKHR